MSATVESRMFEVITSMFTACPVIPQETPIMAVARLLTAAERTITVLEEFGLADDFLVGARTAMLENISLALNEPPKFYEWLDEISMEFVAEAKRRNAELLAQPD
jgi:hypothetical protein